MGCDIDAGPDASENAPGDHFAEQFTRVVRQRPLAGTVRGSGSPGDPEGTWLAADLVRHTWPVGFNPFRPQRRRSSDYVFVAAAFVVIAALLVWAFLPR